MVTEPPPTPGMLPLAPPGPALPVGPPGTTPVADGSAGAGLAVIGGGVTISLVTVVLIVVLLVVPVSSVDLVFSPQPLIATASAAAAPAHVAAVRTLTNIAISLLSGVAPEPVARRILK